MKEVTFIDPVSTAKVAALLGILWAVLGWLFSGIVISILVQSSPGELADIPPSFSVGGLVSGMVGGFIGGALSGYLGSHFYNMLAPRIGGIKIQLRGGEENKAPVVPGV